MKFGYIWLLLGFLALAASMVGCSNGNDEVPVKVSGPITIIFECSPNEKTIPRDRRDLADTLRM